jgi:type III pantothenate kinase
LHYRPAEIVVVEFMTAARELIAVDIGNSRLKAGRFHPEATPESSLPEPVDILSLPIVNKTGEFDSDRFRVWCDKHTTNHVSVLVASVHRGAAARLKDTVAGWIEHSQRDVVLRQLSYRDVPLEIHVDEPARVGIDRLLAAQAANRLRRHGEPAIIVGLGTAITVDLLESDGAFAGGAILPGIAMSARALAADTDALPHVDPALIESPPLAVGKSTTAAIESGLVWGTVGAIRELISQFSSMLSTSPELFVTGGASALIVGQFTIASGYRVHHVPHLVLAGIALVNAQSCGNRDTRRTNHE